MYCFQSITNFCKRNNVNHDINCRNPSLNHLIWTGFLTRVEENVHDINFCFQRNCSWSKEIKRVGLGPKKKPKACTTLLSKKSLVIE